MKRHLTEAFIARVRPPKHGYVEAFDLGYPGLALRVGHGGAKSFRLYYRAGAKLRAKKLGRWPDISLAAARDQWRSTREAAAKGEVPQAKPNGLLFETVVEEWLKRDMSQRNTASSLRQVTRMVDGDLLPAWRGRQIGAITKKDVIALLDAVVDRGAKVKANRLHAAMSRLFKWCVSRELLATSPVNGLERQRETSRDRVLTDQELSMVWKGSSSLPIFGHVVKLLTLTGMRREEAPSNSTRADLRMVCRSSSHCRSLHAHCWPVSRA
jgi:hypothetical protein